MFIKDLFAHFFKICLFVTFILLHNSISAENIAIRELPTQSQIHSGNLHLIAEDKEGYMWYATDEGLYRDNGYQLEVFRSSHQNSTYIASNKIHTLAVDTSDHVWFGTQTHLYRLDKSDYSIKEIENKDLKAQMLEFVKAANDGTLWVVADNRIVHLNQEGETLKTYPQKNPGDGHKFINSIHEDSSHNIWAFLCRGGLLRYDNTRDEFVTCEWPVGLEPHGGMVEDSQNGCYWISTWGKGVVRYKPYRLGYGGTLEYQPCTCTDAQDRNSRGQIVSMAMSGRTLYCTAMDGFYAYDIRSNGTLTVSSQKLNLHPRKKIMADMMVDSNGDIWVASYSPSSFIISRTEDGIENHTLPMLVEAASMNADLMSVSADADSMLWVLHSRQGPVMYNPFLRTHQSVFPDNKTGNQILCASPCRSGAWYSSDRTLYYLDRTRGGRIDARVVTQLKERITHLLDMGREGLWIAAGGSLVLYDTKKNNVERVLECGLDDIRKMCASGNRRHIYVLSASCGVYDIDIRTGKQTLLSKDINSALTAMCISPKDTLYVASNVGTVYKYAAGMPQLQYDKSKDMPNGEHVYACLCDREGKLWLLTRQSLKITDSSSHRAVMYKSKDDDFEMDYLSDMTFCGGRICVSGSNGLAFFDSKLPSSAGQNIRKPVISSIVIDGERQLFMPSSGEIELKHWNINTSVSFTTFDMLHAGDIRFAYSLHDESQKAEQWVYLQEGQNTATFTVLSPGVHILEVKSTDIYGNWGSPLTCLKIVQLPAWWHTWWMYAVYAVVFIAIITAVALVRLRLMIQRAEITKLVDLAKELRQTANMAVANQKTEMMTAATEKNEEKSAALSREDIQFIQKAKQSVSNNLRNPAYNTESLASDMCMSRMSLYRRIQRTTGQAPSEFIRMIRLQNAAIILRNEDRNISEVSRMVGFATPSYFSKCFKESFGVLPQDYTGRRKTGN